MCRVQDQVLDRLLDYPSLLAVAAVLKRLLKKKHILVAEMQTCLVFGYSAVHFPHRVKIALPCQNAVNGVAAGKIDPLRKGGYADVPFVEDLF